MANGNDPPRRPDPRFRPPSPRQAGKTFAVLRALLGHDSRHDPRSAIDVARDAYTAEPENPRAYPMPAPVNFLANLVADPKSTPKAVRNWLVEMAQGAAQDPLLALMPVPKTMMAARAARIQKLKAYPAARAAFDAERMAAVNRFMAEQRTPFAQGLEPPPSMSAPVKQYITERHGGLFGPRVDVVGEIASPPERITLEQARAAGVSGPEAMPAPPYRFTRTGPRAEIVDDPPRTVPKGTAGDNAGSKLTGPRVPKRIKGSNDLVDGLRVGKNIANRGSIGSSLSDWQTLPGVRRMQMSDFGQDKPHFYSASEKARTEQLAEQIKRNGRIDPLIIVQDDQGYYVLEGGHRFDALQLLGKKEFPALVVRDLEHVPRLRRRK